MRPSILLGKAVAQASHIAKRSGSTWPGHIALKVNSQFVQGILQKNPQLQVVLLAGTNGKTTTTKLVQEVLESTGKKVFRNAAGANLLNGIASTLLKHSNINGKINYDVAIFEVDENSLPLIVQELHATKNEVSIILLNLFRDQLDRYGEVNTIAKKWLFSFQSLTKRNINLIVNGDDPMLSFIGAESGLTTFYFGLDQKHMKKKEAPHDVDFLFCPKCGTELQYSKRSYSHMGIFSCPKCNFKHPETETFDDLPNPMLGLYNKYNINAAALLLDKVFQIKPEQTKKVLLAFAPAFGRQEKISYKGKNIFLLLSKNPTGYNQSIQAILESSNTPNVLLLLNDRIPDGKDISWIWDTELEQLVEKAKNITVSGDRAYDMGLRVKYAQEAMEPSHVEENLELAINTALNKLDSNDTLYILATYSAMLETRQILKGRAIL